MIGLFGSITMIASFACVKFMPVPDAITLIFTTPLFTMVIAAIFMKERITLIKAGSGKITYTECFFLNMVHFYWWALTYIFS